MLKLLDQLTVKPTSMRCLYQQYKEGNQVCFVKIQKSEKYFWLDFVTKDEVGSGVVWKLERKKFDLSLYADMEAYKLLKKHLKPLPRDKFEQAIELAKVESSREGKLLLKSVLLAKITSYLNAKNKD